MKKNVIFILTDDQRYNTIHALEIPEIHTPNLDWLAENGTVFEQAHIPGGTNVSDLYAQPGHAQFRPFPVSSGSGGRKHPGGRQPLQRSSAGTDTTATARASGTTDALLYPWGSQAGKTYLLAGCGPLNEPVSHHDPTGEYDNVINSRGGLFITGETIQVHCDEFHPGVHSTELLTNTALDYLENRPQDRPFICILPIWLPMIPCTMPQRFKELYDPETSYAAGKLMERHPLRWAWRISGDEILLPTPLTEEAVRRELADYYAMTSIWIMRLKVAQSLREKNLLRILFWCSPATTAWLWDAMGCWASRIYDLKRARAAGLAGAGIPKTKKVENYVYLMDIYPTLCELTGHEVPDTVEGKSLWLCSGTAASKPGRPCIWPTGT